MTVEEIKLMRKALESDILKLLRRFQGETGLHPAQIDLQHLSDCPMGLPNERRLVGVTVEVTL